MIRGTAPDAVNPMVSARGLILGGTDLDELGTFRAAAIQGRIPFGPGTGMPTRLCDGEVPRRTTVKKKLCADHRGFSLHAAVRISAGSRDRLERLCRHVTRPPFAIRPGSVGDHQ